MRESCDEVSVSQMQWSSRAPARGLRAARPQRWLVVSGADARGSNTRRAHALERVSPDECEERVVYWDEPECYPERGNGRRTNAISFPYCLAQAKWEAHAPLSRVFGPRVFRELRSPNWRARRPAEGAPESHGGSCGGRSSEPGTPRQ